MEQLKRFFTRILSHKQFEFHLTIILFFVEFIHFFIPNDLCDKIQFYAI